jgi:hypothetical protein
VDVAGLPELIDEFQLLRLMHRLSLRIIAHNLLLLQLLA